MAHGAVLLVGHAHGPRWRQGVVGELIAAGLDPARRDAAELAVHEAVCNAREHGHLGDTSLPIGLELSQPRIDRLVVAVEDRALGGRWSGASMTVVGRQRGHGLALIRAGCDELRITAEPGTTRVAMTFVPVRHPVPGMGANGLER